MNRLNQQSATVALLVPLLLMPTLARAIDFNRIVVFGTSLSDPGNAFALARQAMRPLNSGLDAFLIPSSPYAIGGYHFSNGATWIEQLARRIGRDQDVRPAYAPSKHKAFNYAVGGARARRDGMNQNLPDQVATFLFDVEYAAPSDALYVIDMGANDVRDALASGSEEQSQIIIGEALTSMAAQLTALHFFGARKFLVLNVADLGLLPSVRILDEIFPGTAGFSAQLARSFNYYLDFVRGALAADPEVEITRLDIYSKLSEIIADPRRHGVSETAATCLTPGDEPSPCRNPNNHLFWDGIHPTAAGHGIFAREAARILDLNLDYALLSDH